MKEILTEVNLDSTNKSNHSLRATAISRLYQGHVPEKLIMERSGHLTRDGLGSYECTTPAQEKSLCNILAKPGSSSITSEQPAIVNTSKVEDSLATSHEESSSHQDVKQEGDSSAAEELKKATN